MAQPPPSCWVGVSPPLTAAPHGPWPPTREAGGGAFGHFAHPALPRVALQRPTSRWPHWPPSGAQTRLACSWLDIQTASGAGRWCPVPRCPPRRRTGSGSGFAPRPRGWLSTTCRAGPLHVPSARAGRRLGPATAAAGLSAGRGQLTPGPSTRVWSGGSGDGDRPTPVSCRGGTCSWVPGASESHVPLQATAGTTSRLLPNRG